MSELSNYRPGMTVEETIAAFIADGMSREDAEVRANLLHFPTTEGLPVL